MKIDGKEIASKIIDDLKIEMSELKKHRITPRIAIVTLGPEASWQAYVGQKIKLAEKLGIETHLINLVDPTEAFLFETIFKLNNDRSIHGIIIQRPFPHHIHNDIMVKTIVPEKDIDGFRNDSPFEVPVWMAVRKILEFVYSNSDDFTKKLKRGQTSPEFAAWLQSKTIAVVGKGITAGTPTIHGLNKLNINPIVISRSTPEPQNELKKADIIISAVGKRVVEPQDLKNGVVLIGVGLHRGEDGKLHGDYDESEVEHIASFYTPSPGGVGPVNLAFLFQNLITAAKNYLH